MDWTALASIATALGVLFMAGQLFDVRRIAQSQFEDNLDQQYRALTREIPVEVLLGEAVPNELRREAAECVFNYFDLCNEQVFLRIRRRVRKDTFADWSLGMRQHLGKPFFREQWHRVQDADPEAFTFLNQLIEHQFRDPLAWKGEAVPLPIYTPSANYHSAQEHQS